MLLVLRPLFYRKVCPAEPSGHSLLDYKILKFLAVNYSFLFNIIITIKKHHMESRLVSSRNKQLFSEKLSSDGKELIKTGCVHYRTGCSI